MSDAARFWLLFLMIGAGALFLYVLVATVWDEMFNRRHNQIIRDRQAVNEATRHLPLELPGDHEQVWVPPRPRPYNHEDET